MSLLKGYAEKMFRTHYLVKGISDTLIAQDAEVKYLYKKSSKQAELPFNRGKIIVLGDSGVGKTSTCKHLIEEAINPSHDSTHFIDTFQVTSAEIGSDWQRLDPRSVANDYKRSRQWWTVLHMGKSYQKESSTETMKEALWLAVTTLLVISISFGGFPAGLATSQWAMILALLKYETLHMAYNFGCGVVMYVAVWDLAYAHNSQNGNQIGYIIWFLMFGILLSMGCRSGLYFGFCYMITAPFEYEINEMYFSDFSYFADVTFQHVIHEFSARLLMAGKVIVTSCIGFFGCKQLYSLYALNHQNEIRKVLPNTLLFCIVSLPIFGLVYIVPAWGNIVSSMFSGSMVYIGMNLYGKRLSLHIERAKIWKIAFGFVFATTTGVMLGLRFKTYRILQALPSILIDIYFYWFVKRTTMVDDIPVEDLCRAFKTIAKGNDKMPSIWTLMDFAGQKVYYDLHHIFLAQKAVYLIVFSLEEAVKSFEEQFSRILFWLQRVRVHTSKSENKNIFLIGTHRESVSDDEASRFTDYVSEKISVSRYAKHIVANTQNSSFLFKTENSIENINLDRDGLYLRETIGRVCESNTDFTKSYRLSWLRVLDVMKMMRESGYVFVSVEDIKSQVETTYGEQICQRSFTEALQLACEAAEILYVSEGDCKNWAVLQPTFLIDFIKRLLNRNISVVDPNYKFWKIFWETSVANIALFSVIVQEATKEAPRQRDDVKERLKPVIEYLKLYDYIHELPRSISAPSFVRGFAFSEETENKWYVIPSMLKESECSISELQPQLASLSFIFDFGDASLDQMFPSLVTRCLDRYKSNNTTYNFPEHLYRNMVILQAPNRYEYALEVLKSYLGRSLIKVHVWVSETDDSDESDANPWHLPRALNSHVSHLAERYFCDVIYTCGVECDNRACTADDQPHVLDFYASSDASFPVGKQRLFCRGRQQNVHLPHADVITDNPLNDSALWNISSRLGFEWEGMALQLGVPFEKLQQFKMANPHDPTLWAQGALRCWRDALTAEEKSNAVDELKRALVESGRTDLMHMVDTAAK